MNYYVLRVFYFNLHLKSLIQRRSSFVIIIHIVFSQLIFQQ